MTLPLLPATVTGSGAGLPDLYQNIENNSAGTEAPRSFFIIQNMVRYTEGLQSEP